jgi:hypothetical protein
VTETTSEALVAARVDPDAHDLLDETFADRARGLAPRPSLFGAFLHAIQQLAAWVGP